MIDELYSKISKILVKKDLTESDVDHAMTLVRKIQERDGTKNDNFKLLNFFIDWTKHVVLDRNALGYAAILELNELLYQTKDSKDISQVRDNITALLSFVTLRDELREFLTKHSLPTSVVDVKSQWNRFSILLINIISDCSLYLPDKKRSQVRRSIKEGVVANAMKLSWVDPQLFKTYSLKPTTKGFAPGEKILSLIITLSDTTTIWIMFPIYNNLYLTSSDLELQ